MQADRTRRWNVKNDSGRFGDEAYYISCPGCGSLHVFSTAYDSGESIAKAKALRGDGAAPLWTFNKNLGRPTFRPSMLVTWGGRENRDSTGKLISNVPKQVCHSFVTDGRIQFLNDCTHSLKGQTVDLPEVGKA